MMRGELPAAWSAAMAAFTHGVSGLSLSRTTLRSALPSPLSNWPTATALGTWTLVTKYAVGRSTTSAVDLAVAERLHREVVGVEHLRVLGRLDHVDDRVVAGGPDLGAEHEVLEAGDRGHGREGLSFRATTDWVTS